MAKAKHDPRSMGEILAGIRTVQDRLGHVAHFVRMANELFVALDDPDMDLDTLRKVAAKVRETHTAAAEALNGAGGESA